MKSQIMFITGNSNKVQEAEAILGVTLDHVNLDLPEIQGSAQEVIIAKAEEAYRRVGKPVMVEDTSLGANVLNGLPGPFIKFFQPVGWQNFYKMLIGFGDFSGFALCLIAVKFDAYSEPVLFEGRVDGTIGPVRGDHGFGWDPVFTPLGHTESFAEMDAKTKNKISHRKIAFEKVRDYFENQDSV